MRSVRATVLVIVLAGLTAGCLSIKSYVDPFLPQVGYGDLLPRRDVRPAVLTVAFHRNGEPASLGTSRARDEIRAVFEKSKLFSAVSDKSTDDFWLAQEERRPPTHARIVMARVITFVRLTLRMSRARAQTIARRLHSRVRRPLSHSSPYARSTRAVS